MAAAAAAAGLLNWESFDLSDKTIPVISVCARGDNFVYLLATDGRIFVNRSLGWTIENNAPTDNNDPAIYLSVSPDDALMLITKSGAAYVNLTGSWVTLLNSQILCGAVGDSQSYVFCTEDFFSVTTGNEENHISIVTTDGLSPTFKRLTTTRNNDHIWGLDLGGFPYSCSRENTIWTKRGNIRLKQIHAYLTYVDNVLQVFGTDCEGNGHRYNVGNGTWDLVFFNDFRARFISIESAEFVAYCLLSTGDIYKANL